MLTWGSQEQGNGTGADLEVFDYPAVAGPPMPSWEAFGKGVLSDCGARGNREAAGKTTDACNSLNAGMAREAHAEEMRRSFESGRQRGLEEGRAAEREAWAAQGKDQEARRADQAVRLAESFNAQRALYFETVEHEVVKLALGVAARILRRESQMDPLLLSGAVRVALGQLSASTQVRLRVPASDLDLWSDTIAHLPNLAVKPAVVGDDALRLGECMLEAELGSVDLGMGAQLAEIERGFFDRTGPDRDPTRAIAVTEEMSE